ncbi:MAG: four helix bundle protein [Armatimonadetes bacterium]|nr:four helix bundle protein [Armatimonadota bacterium]
MQVVQDIYRMTQDFPRAEIYGLASQMRRAAVSIPSNIAEGHTRESTKEFLQHVSIAQGSLAELQTQTEIAQRLGYISSDDAGEFLAASSSLAKQLYSLRNALSVGSRASAARGNPAPSP